MHLLVFDAQRIEVKFSDPLTILSSDGLCQPPLELGIHRLLLLTLPLLILEVHLMLVLALHLTEPDTFTHIEMRLLNLRDAAILQGWNSP